MNCLEFEAIVNELASGHLWDSAKREGGLAHANDCARCSARLANERLLSYELGALVREERYVQAPHRLKQDLMAAFAVRDSAPMPAAVEFPAPPQYQGLYLAMAIAAAVIIALALFLPLRGWFGRSAPEQAGQVASVPAVTVSPRDASPAPIADAANIPAPSNEVTATVTTDRTIAPSTRRRVAPHSRNGSGLGNSEQVAARTEVTSGFIPLTYLNVATAAENGVVLRVEVSRDKLVALGLPLNLERSGETIKADIIVGDDGVARAIRLVE